MIRLEMSVHEGHAKMLFQLPEEQDETVRMDELSTFALHLDVVKHRIVALMSRAIAKGEGYEIAANK